MSKASPSLPYGALDLLVLRTLAGGPRHGYGILVQIHEASNQLLRIEEGSLYPALHRLETTGLLKAEWAVSENNRRAKSLQLDGQRPPTARRRRTQLGTRRRGGVARAPVRVKETTHVLDAAADEHLSAGRARSED